MDVSSDGGRPWVRSLSHQLSPADVNTDLTRCGLLVERAEALARLYREHGNWNDVKDRWFDERLSNRSTRSSAQAIFRVLTSRLKNAPPSLPNPRDLPEILDRCATARDEAQVLSLYLVEDDALVRYVVHEYVSRIERDHREPLDFSDDTLGDILRSLEYADGSAFDYADSTTGRWCDGFRSVMREIDVLGGQRDVVGSPPAVGDIPLLVALGYSYEVGGEDWVNAPRGLLYLFQPEDHWDELFDRAARTDAWEFVELHGDLRLRPTETTYDWATGGAR